MFECEFYMLGSILFIYMVGNYKLIFKTDFRRIVVNRQKQGIVVNKINWFVSTYYLCVFAGHKIMGSVSYKEGTANLFFTLLNSLICVDVMG